MMGHGSGTVDTLQGVVSLEEAGRLLSRHPKTISRWCRRGWLDRREIAGDRRAFVTRASVERRMVCRDMTVTDLADLVFRLEEEVRELKASMGKRRTRKSRPQAASKIDVERLLGGYRPEPLPQEPPPVLTNEAAMRAELRRRHPEMFLDETAPESGPQKISV